MPHSVALRDLMKEPLQRCVVTLVPAALPTLTVALQTDFDLSFLKAVVFWDSFLFQLLKVLHGHSHRWFMYHWTLKLYGGLHFREVMLYIYKSAIMLSFLSLLGNSEMTF